MRWVRQKIDVTASIPNETSSGHPLHLRLRSAKLVSLFVTAPFPRRRNTAKEAAIMKVVLLDLINTGLLHQLLRAAEGREALRELAQRWRARDIEAWRVWRNCAIVGALCVLRDCGR